MKPLVLQPNMSQALICKNQWVSCLKMWIFDSLVWIWAWYSAIQTGSQVIMIVPGMHFKKQHGKYSFRALRSGSFSHEYLRSLEKQAFWRLSALHKSKYIPPFSLLLLMLLPHSRRIDMYPEGGREEILLVCMNITLPFGVMTISTFRLLEMLGDPHSLTKLPEQTPQCWFQVFSDWVICYSCPQLAWWMDGFLRDWKCSLGKGLCDVFLNGKLLNRLGYVSV